MIMSVHSFRSMTVSLETGADLGISEGVHPVRTLLSRHVTGSYYRYYQILTASHGKSDLCEIQIPL